MLKVFVVVVVVVVELTEVSITMIVKAILK
jgi:hypothetical protein